ncbi:MAG: sensor histidine kinase [Bacteriovorax sp.]|nr:sensor histidine kinase [Bacteriovorax sp.]
MKIKSIYSIIHDNLRKALLLSLGTTAVVLVIFSYYSLRAVEEHATHFLMKHAEGLAQAGINAQNVGDVDKEISRFAEAWKETQDLDVRIDIFIDGKLIAHAGQLQPFKFLYTDVNKNVALPSGQTLNAEVQIGLKQLVIIRGIELLVFELFIILVYFSLVHRMKKTIAAITSPLELRVSWLKNVASKLPESSKTPPPFDTANVTEIDDLSQSIELLLNEIVKLEDHIATVNFDRGRVKMAEQVAHNIKGAIATLQLKISSLSNLATSDKQEFIECVNSIRDVSVNLLKAKKDGNKTPGIIEMTSPKIHLMPIVSNAFEMKRKQYHHNLKLQMIFDDTKKLDGISLRAETNELQSVIDNLIDNSVEAIEDNDGVIALQVNVNNRQIKIQIKDNGKGIPFDILEKLMDEGGSYGKVNGTGIGLVHAKETLEKIGGKIKIDSTLGHGTTVTLLIPRFEDADKFVGEIKINEGSTLLVIDDDKLIHEIWKSKFKRSGLPILQVHHFLNPDDFNTWMDENGHGEYGSRHYFFDYDLKDESFNGLDLIEHHGLALESIFVSGLAGDSEIYSRAKKLGVRCLRKDLLNDTSIVGTTQI